MQVPWFASLSKFVGFVLWATIGFSLYRLTDSYIPACLDAISVWLTDNVLAKLSPSLNHLWLRPVALLFGFVWLLLYTFVRKVLKGRVDRLLCGDPIFNDGADDHAGIYATLAGFALAQGAALTAVAKGEGRDLLVIGVYVIIVGFTYAWARMFTVLGDQKFTESTLIQSRFTLAWILFLASIMFVLGTFGLLPNQTWRQLYNRTGNITCLTAPARVYATTTDQEQQLMHKWIKWASSAAAPESQQTVLLVETGAGFEGDFRTFVATIECLERFEIVEVVAFLRTQDSPAEQPDYQQLRITEPAAGEKWRVTIADPNKRDKVVLLCVVEDRTIKPMSQTTIDPNKSFWLTPVFQD